jgi:catechol-2,3-dioxygenase
MRDVEASSQWYQRLLGLRSDHGGATYERLADKGTLVLQLHCFESPAPTVRRSSRPSREARNWRRLRS